MSSVGPISCELAVFAPKDVKQSVEVSGIIDSLPHLILQIGIVIGNVAIKKMPNKMKCIEFTQILKMPQELRTRMVEYLSGNDLNALELALGKDNGKFKEYTPAAQQIRKLIDDIRPQKILSTLHPMWKEPAASWQIPLKDKIWLVRVSEVNYYNFFADLFKNLQPKNYPELLGRRASIEKFLSSITYYNACNYVGYSMKIPDGVCLFVNLTHFIARSSALQNTYYWGQFKKLEVLDITTESTSPPDVTHNPQLKVLKIHSPIESSPDLSRNPLLTILKIQSTALCLPPNTRHNPNLTDLTIYAPIVVSPDLSHHPQLTHLSICGGRLGSYPPVIRHNPELTDLNITSCELTESPDLSQNLKLRSVDFSRNKLTTFPNVTPNHFLRLLSLTYNPIYNLPDRSNLHICSFALPGTKEDYEAQIRREFGCLIKIP